MERNGVRGLKVECLHNAGMINNTNCASKCLIIMHYCIVYALDIKT